MPKLKNSCLVPGTRTVVHTLAPRDSGKDKRAMKSRAGPVAESKAARKPRVAASKDARKPRVAASKDARKPRVAANKDARKPRVAANKDARKPRAAARKDARKPRVAARKDARKPHIAASKDTGRLRISSAKASKDSKQARVARALENRASKDARKLRVERALENKAAHVRDIKIAISDEYESMITGCVKLPGDKLVVVDCTNDKLKLFRGTNHAMSSQLKLDCKLWDITQTGESQVAVTCPDENTICFVNVSDQLQLEREVKVKGQCWGIASIEENLVVSYGNPTKVEVISKTGHVMRTVVTEELGRRQFGLPWYVAVSHLNNTIYVSDWQRNTVISIDMTGKVKATYKHGDLQSPEGLAVGRSGELYVCCHDSNTVHRLTAGLTHGQVVLRTSDGLRNPKSMHYCLETETIFIGMMDNDVVKVYQIE